MASGIYCIENLINHKKYIGQSYYLNKRIGSNHKGCDALFSAFEKYGRENFVSRIVLYCEIEELDYYEVECIKIFHSHYGDWGYNICWGGNAPVRGRTLSDEWKRKISDALKGRPVSKNSLRALLENRPDMKGDKSPLYGIPISDWHKKRLSEANSGPKNALFGTKKYDASSRYFGIDLGNRKYMKKNGEVSVHPMWNTIFRIL